MHETTNHNPSPADSGREDDMNSTQKLTRKLQAIRADYYARYYNGPLWSGSVEAPQGWYLCSTKYAATENNGRGKWLGGNARHALATINEGLPEV